MTPPRQRKAGPAEAPKIQDRPAGPAAPKVLDPDNRDGEFLPNPTAPHKAGPAVAETYDLRVVGPREVGGVRAPGKVSMELTPRQLDALLFGGHVEAWTEDSEPEDKPPAGDEDEGDSPNEEGTDQE